MKKLFFTFFAALLMACGCNKTEQFKVTINLENAENQAVYLYKEADGKHVLLDSAVVVDKTAVLTADADDPQICYLIKFDKSEYESCGGFFQFFTENQNTTISGDIDALQKWTVKGCPAMDVYNAFREEFLPMEETLMTIMAEGERANQEGDTIRLSDLSAQFEDAMNDYMNQHLNFIKGQPDNYYTHFLLNGLKEEFELEDLKDLVDGYTTESVYLNSIKEYIEQMESMQ